MVVEMAAAYIAFYRQNFHPNSSKSYFSKHIFYLAHTKTHLVHFLNLARWPNNNFVFIWGRQRLGASNFQFQPPRPKYNISRIVINYNACCWLLVSVWIIGVQLSPLILPCHSHTPLHSTVFSLKLSEKVRIFVYTFFCGKQFPHDIAQQWW